MKILYHLTVLPPQRPRCEALSQEIQILQDYFGGKLVYVNPNQSSPLYIPRLLFGISQLKALHDHEHSVDLHHLYNPDPYPFPYLLRLRKPVIYTVSSGVNKQRINVGFLNKLAAVTVYDKRSLQHLRSAGLQNVHLIPPGIDTSRFTHTPLPLPPEGKIKLLMASAPWTPNQFHTKGIEALLEAARQFPRLYLTFLWREVLTEKMERRIRDLGLTQRVTLINKYVDVNRVFAGVHATIALATDPAIIKAYPHSLLDSLAAGKPVLISKTIPMAEYVKEKNCGVVVDNIAAESILEAITTLENSYKSLAMQAQKVGQRDFSLSSLLQAYGHLYRRVLQ